MKTKEQQNKKKKNLNNTNQPLHLHPINNEIKLVFPIKQSMVITFL